MVPYIKVEDIALSRQIVAESDAFSARTPLLIENELKEGVFSVIPIQLTGLVLNYDFMDLLDRALSPATEKYMSLLREV